jgi:uncharacterized protein DUF3667
MSTLALGSACANCGARLTGIYCAACGQKARRSRPTVRDFMHELAEELFSYDGKIYRSVWLLFARPGFLTREAFADRRASYVSPLRLYVFFSVLFFATFAFAPNLINVNYTYTPSKGEQADPAVDVRFDPTVVEQKKTEIRTAVNEVTGHFVPHAMFLLMPVFAGLVMLFRRKSGRTYPEHIYFAMHVHAVAFFAATLVVLANIVVVPYLSAGAKGVGLLFAGTHFARSFRSAYGTTWLGTLWRTALISLLYSFVLLATLLAIWLPTAWHVIKQQ